MKPFSWLLLLLLVCGFNQPKGHNVIQFNISSILNARPVTTLSTGKLATWKTGIDGNGKADGYLTRSAAKFNGDPDEHALPDEPLIAANSFHPEVRLHYSNHDTLNYQACSLPGDTSVAFSVPKGKYSMLYFALTSAEGSSSMKFHLTYADGEYIDEILLPDYYQDIPTNDPSLCYLVHDLAKWGPTNKMTEKDHHNIDLVQVQADPTRTLLEIKINKGKPGYVVFWAAAGKLK